MAPKGNPKAVAAREAKAGRENEKKSKESAAKEAEEEAEWGKGAKKAKPDDKAAKAEAARAAKAARDAALAEEEAALASSKAKPAPKAGAKKPAKIATPAAKSSPGTSAPGTPGAGGAGGGGVPSFEDAMNADPESFSASNLDDALSLLSLVNEKQDKASLGSKAAQTLDAHPERRYKAAFAAYKERELPVLRKEHPGLRLQQYEELMFKNFKKSPENPFNQATVAFDATKEEKLEALKKLRAETENRLREKSA